MVLPVSTLPWHSSLSWNHLGDYTLAALSRLYAVSWPVLFDSSWCPSLFHHHTRTSFSSAYGTGIQEMFDGRKKEKEERRRAPARPRVVLRKERSYGLESDHFPEEVGQVALSPWYGVSSPTLSEPVIAPLDTRLFSENLWNNEVLREVADLLLWEIF